MCESLSECKGWMLGEEGCVIVLPEACSLFSTNRTETFLCLLFLCTAFFYWVNTGTQQAIFQNNIRVMLLTSSFPTVYNASGRAEWGVTLHGLEIILQTSGVTGTEELWQSNDTMYVGFFPKLNESKHFWQDINGKSTEPEHFSSKPSLP